MMGPRGVEEEAQSMQGIQQPFIQFISIEVQHGFIFNYGPIPMYNLMHNLFNLLNTRKSMDLIS